MAAPDVPVVLVEVDAVELLGAPVVDVLVDFPLGDVAVAEVPVVVPPPGPASEDGAAIELPLSPPAWLVPCATAAPVNASAPAIAAPVNVRLNTEFIVDLL
jgi:hypothetical protein